jgi:hypothetical protein
MGTKLEMKTEDEQYGDDDSTRTPPDSQSSLSTQDDDSIPWLCNEDDFAPSWTPLVVYKPYVSEFGKETIYHTEKRKQKYQEVVRKKKQRAALPGHICKKCKAFWEAMIWQRIYTKETLPNVLKDCSKHKASYSTSSTPDGVWDIDIPTPDAWKEQDREIRGSPLR